MTMPPIIGPSMGAICMPMPWIAMAWPRRSGGNWVKMSAMIIGCMTPAEKPCSTRPSTTISKLVPKKASAVPAKNTQLITTNAPRTPRARANQALSSWLATIVATNPVASHCAWSCPTPKAPITVGTATLAIVDESTIAIAPAMPAPVTSHLLVGMRRRLTKSLRRNKTQRHSTDV